MAVSISLLYIVVLLQIESAVKLPLQGNLNEQKRWKRSTDVQISGRPEQGYFIDIFLGTPAKRFSVVVDTGSSNFAIAASPDVGTDNYFNTKQSSTLSEKRDKKIKVQYFNGTWQGYFASDIFKFCETCKGGNVDVALITSSTNFFVSPSLWQGILGLGYKKLIQPAPEEADTVLDSLTEANVATQIFSIEMCGRQNQDTAQLTGTLELDASADDSSYIYTDIVKQWYYQIEITNLTVGGEPVVEDCYELNKPQAILDSGTTNLLLPSYVYFKVMATIEPFSYIAAYVTPGNKQELHEEIRSFIQRKDFLCKDTEMDIFSWFPDIVISIAHNSTHHFSINIPPQQYIRQTMDSINKQEDITSKTKCYMFAVQESRAGTILGAAFLEQLTVLHDRTNSKIGLKLAANCKVSDPVFKKEISLLFNRTDGGCITAPRSSLPTVALAVTLTLIISTLLAIACWWNQDSLKSHVLSLCLRFKRAPNYTYMLNSEDEDSSLQMELDEIRTEVVN